MQFSLHQQQNIEFWGKRQRFRESIRRRAIDQQRQLIRNYYIEQESTQSIPRPDGQACTTTTECQSTAQNNHRSSDKQKRQGEDFQQVDSDSQEYISSYYHVGSSNSTAQSQLLHELTLTNSQRLCKPAVISQLSKVIKQFSYSHNSAHIGRILQKMCCNEAYWQPEFIDCLVQLIVDLCELGAEMGTFLQLLSSCTLVLHKMHLYRLMLRTGVLDKLVQKAKTGQNSVTAHSNLTVLTILYNFIMVTPYVNYQHSKFLRKQSHQQSKQFYVSALVGLITKIAVTLKKQPSKDKLVSIDNANAQKFLLLLQIVYSLLHRVQDTESYAIINQMHSQKWKLILLIFNFVQNCFADPNDCKSTKLQSKIKYKALQISYRLLLQHEYRSESELSLSFLYASLPSLMLVVFNDFHTCRRKVEDSGSLGPSEFSNKYEQLLLQVMGAMLGVYDQVGKLPALEYILAKYGSFLEEMYEIYDKFFAHNARKFNIMAWITNSLLQNLPNPCSCPWISHFVQNLIVNQGEHNLLNFSEVVCSLMNLFTNHNNFRHDCLLSFKLTENQIVNKLEDLAMKIADSDIELSRNIETLMTVLHQNRYSNDSL